MHMPPYENLAALVVESIKNKPLAPVVWEDGEGVFAGTFLNWVANRQAHLVDYNVKTGDHVLVCNGRGVRFWADMLAVWASGAVAIPFDIEMSATNAQSLIERVIPKLAITDMESVPATLTAACAVVTDVPSSDEQAELKIVQGMSGKTASILFTSGSTGLPKGVVQKHSALIGNALATQKRLSMRWEDRLFMATPFVFVSALSHFLVCMIGGGTFIPTEKKLFKGDLAKALVRSNANCFGGAPVQVRWIAEISCEKPLHLNWLMSSGDHMGTDIIKMVEALKPEIRLFTVYGMTELGGRFCILDPTELKSASGSVGVPIEGLEFSIRDEIDLRVLPEGEIGEVIANGSYLFAGYYKDEESTAECMTEFGMRTGDVGYFDRDGRLYLRGRNDDVFKNSGKKVSVLPISEALMETGYFEDVAVAGQAHSMWGHVPHVFFKALPGRELDKRAVMMALREKLPANHLPSGFTEVDAIPRTGSGKIKRAWLRDVVARLGPAG